MSVEQAAHPRMKADKLDRSIRAAIDMGSGKARCQIWRMRRFKHGARAATP
jgi:hypothetical protein